MYPKELIQKIHQSSPQEVVEVIASEKTLEIINSIAGTYGLSVDKLRKLESLLSLRIMGLLTKSELPIKISSELGVSPDIASKITSDINSQIIPSIPEGLLAAQEKMAQKLINKEAILITSEETKQEVMKRLSGRMEVARGGVAQDLGFKKNDLGMEQKHPNLPMVEPGEIVHDVAPTAQAIEPLKTEPPKPQTSPSTTRYPSGKDPYREPLA